MIGVLFFAYSLLGTQKKGSRSTSETRYLSQRKKQFNDKTKTLLSSFGNAKESGALNERNPLLITKKKAI
ncbi:hypothetical protein [Avibacterium avium]|uniref:hypothetical protein n=1 Tax=Avibacterium avium TaxID=751 RepID=UPI003BF8BFE0